jgi:hypothetical protein
MNAKDKHVPSAFRRSLSLHQFRHFTQAGRHPVAFPCFAVVAVCQNEIPGAVILKESRWISSEPSLNPRQHLKSVLIVLPQTRCL